MQRTVLRYFSYFLRTQILTRKKSKVDCYTIEPVKVPLHSMASMIPGSTISEVAIVWQEQFQTDHWDSSKIGRTNRRYMTDKVSAITKAALHPFLKARLWKRISQGCNRVPKCKSCPKVAHSGGDQIKACNVSVAASKINRALKNWSTF